MAYTKKYISKFKYLIDQIKNEEIESLTKIFKRCKKKNNSVFIFGNGGSASISSHVSTDLNKIYKIKSRNFNEANHITCFSNDYGYEKVFSRQIEGLGDKGDVLICLSTSGKSKNILSALTVAKNLGIFTISLLGKNGGDSKGLSDLEIIIPSLIIPFFESS